MNSSRYQHHSQMTGLSMNKRMRAVQRGRDNSRSLINSKNQQKRALRDARRDRSKSRRKEILTRRGHCDESQNDSCIEAARQQYFNKNDQTDYTAADEDNSDEQSTLLSKAHYKQSRKEAKMYDKDSLEDVTPGETTYLKKYEEAPSRKDKKKSKFAKSRRLGTFGDNGRDKQHRDDSRYPLSQMLESSGDTENDKFARKYGKKGLPRLEEESSQAYTYDTHSEDSYSDDETSHLNRDSRQDRKPRGYRQGMETDRVEFSHAETTFDESTFSHQPATVVSKKSKHSRSDQTSTTTGETVVRKKARKREPRH